MDNLAKKEVLEILKQSYDALQSDEVRRLRELSNRIVHSSALYQDESVIAVSVVVYGLSKMYERNDYREKREWLKFHQFILENLDLAYKSLMNSREDEYVICLQRLLGSIEKSGNKLRGYIQEVMYKAHINKGSRFYEHGISLGRTAGLLGISKWELMEYIGNTGIADVEESVTLSAKERLEIARRAFI